MQKRCLPVPPVRKESQQASAPPADDLRLANISLAYGLGAFQSAAFALGPAANASVCEPSKSGISVPYRPVSPGK